MRANSFREDGSRKDNPKPRKRTTVSGVTKSRTWIYLDSDTSETLARRMKEVLQFEAERRAEVAAEIGIAPNTLYDLQHGRIPSLAVLNLLCRWSGRSPNWFLGYDEGALSLARFNHGDRRTIGQVPADRIKVAIRDLAAAPFHAGERITTDDREYDFRLRGNYGFRLRIEGTEEDYEVQVVGVPRNRGIIGSWSTLKQSREVP